MANHVAVVELWPKNGWRNAHCSVKVKIGCGVGLDLDSTDSGVLDLLYGSAWGCVSGAIAGARRFVSGLNGLRHTIAAIMILKQL